MQSEFALIDCVIPSCVPATKNARTTTTSRQPLLARLCFSLWARSRMIQFKMAQKAKDAAPAAAGAGGESSKKVSTALLRVQKGAHSVAPAR